MNFIIELLKLKEFSAILNVINRLTKKRHYIICMTTDKNTIAKNIVRMLYKNI